jgi:hypothetical protein
MFGPLEKIFAPDEVFTPAMGSFPLMGLQRCRVALLDDWGFNEDIVSYNVQLLWFEGKLLAVAMLQNQRSGHIRYKADDPVFITCLQADLDGTQPDRKTRSDGISGSLGSSVSLGDSCGAFLLMASEGRVVFRLLSLVFALLAAGSCQATSR